MFCYVKIIQINSFYIYINIMIFTIVKKITFKISYILLNQFNFISRTTTGFGLSFHRINIQY